jgi:LPXTG-site transpeptidase (sortase) family protein
MRLAQVIGLCGIVAVLLVACGPRAGQEHPLPAPALSAPAADTPGCTPALASANKGICPPARTCPPEAANPCPASVTVPAIDAFSSLIPLGINPDGSPTVPSVHTPKQAGWLQVVPDGQRPADTDPYVIVGHVDGDHIEGIFYKLKQLKVGDLAYVEWSDGTTRTYKVVRRQQVHKTAFPAAPVYGQTTSPEIRLITCTGAFDKRAKSYVDSLIVYLAQV